jgi:hypothetical protein
MKILDLLIHRDLVKYSYRRKHGISLFSAGMKEYIKLHREVGPPEDIKRVNEGDTTHYENSLFFNNVNYFEDIVSASPLNKIRVVFEVIENRSVNAFATKIVDCPNSVYFVAINSGLINEYVTHFTQSKTIRDLTQGFTALNQVPVDFLKEAALSLAFCFIAYHELGHVYRGHLDYSIEKYSTNGFHELSVNELNVELDGYHETRHLFECDADAFAGSLIVGEVMSRYKQGIESGLISGDSKEIVEELIIFTGSIIYYIFCLFDRDKTDFDGWYPVPPIRASIAIGHMGAQLLKEGFDENDINALLKKSLARAQSSINESGMIQTTTNLEPEIERWSSKYKDKLSGLTKALVDYAPVSIE